MYIQAQMAYQRIVSDQAWTQANSVQHGAVIKANLGTYNGGICGTAECLYSGVPDPDPPDPRVFWPLGSGSTSQRYGSESGSFYHHAKIIRKILNPTIL
jgi:hypothetical protein